MIDKKVFAPEIAKLEDWFGVPQSNKIDALYELLSPRLTTEEFKQACLCVKYSERFFPPPQRFVELSKGNAEARAIQELESATATYSTDGLSDLGKRALELAGGVYSLRFSERPTEFRNQFLRFYKGLAATESRSQLPHSQVARLPHAS